jgi:hypothetical protein
MFSLYNLYKKNPEQSRELTVGIAKVAYGRLVFQVRDLDLG